MRKPNLRETRTIKSLLQNPLVISFRRILTTARDERESNTGLQSSEEGLRDTFLSYYRTQEVNGQLLKMEELEGEAIKLIYDHNRCV